MTQMTHLLRRERYSFLSRFLVPISAIELADVKQRDVLEASYSGAFLFPEFNKFVAFRCGLDDGSVIAILLRSVDLEEDGGT